METVRCTSLQTRETKQRSNGLISRFFINVNLQSQYLPSSIPVISSVNSQINEMIIPWSDIVDEGGSIFQGFAAKTS